MNFITTILYTIILGAIKVWKSFTYVVIYILRKPLKARIIRRLKEAGIQVDGTEPHDIKVHNEKLYHRIAHEETLGLAEAYLEGWWDCDQLDECLSRMTRFGLYKDTVYPWDKVIYYLQFRVFNLQTKVRSWEVAEKHYNLEVELDKNRTWCPRAGCETVCLVGPLEKSEINALVAVTSPHAVQCPTCMDEFCSSCKKAWHQTLTCDENIRRLAAIGEDDTIGIPFDSDLIKCCPMCSVPIEMDEGCAQMMCKRCKHVFCWYCLASLDDDFLLRHYDKGPCKLGHSRASVVWHRAQVIGIFAGFGILLLVASPLLLLVAPCIVCCKCRICSGAAKLEENEADFEDATTLQR